MNDDVSTGLIRAAPAETEAQDTNYLQARVSVRSEGNSTTQLCKTRVGRSYICIRCLPARACAHRPSSYIRNTLYFVVYVYTARIEKLTNCYRMFYFGILSDLEEQSDRLLKYV
jgi:hypothetical protein